MRHLARGLGDGEGNCLGLVGIKKLWITALGKMWTGVTVRNKQMLKAAEDFATMGDVILECAARPNVKAIVSYQVMSSASLKVAVDGLLGAWDRALVKKPLVVGFAVSPTSEREITAAEARALFARSLTASRAEGNRAATKSAGCIAGVLVRI